MQVPLFALPPCPSLSPLARSALPQTSRRRLRLRLPALPSSCRVRSCAADAAPPDSASLQSDVRDLTLVAVPMTAGGDVLFPGGSHLLSLATADAHRLLRSIAGEEPSEFAYLPVSAWGDPATVGTIAVVDDLKLLGEKGDASLLCTGVSRFRVVHLSEDWHTARVELFWDDEPRDSEVLELERLEKKLVETMTLIVRLSIKISDGVDEGRQTALAETLKRMEAFCGAVDEEEGKKLLQNWILQLSPKLRRELLSFIVIDLVSVSFMDRRTLMMSTNTANRLAEALKCLEPFVKELAAKGAIVSALGRNNPEDDSPASPPP